MPEKRKAMKTYRVMNRSTLQWWEGEASSAQEACQKAGWMIQKAGWMIENCWVRVKTPGRDWEIPREENYEESKNEWR